MKCPRDKVVSSQTSLVMSTLMNLHFIVCLCTMSDKMKNLISLGITKESSKTSALLNTKNYRLKHKIISH